LRPGCISFGKSLGAAREHAEASIAICAEQGFPLFMSMGIILRGWALVQEGSDEEGGAQMRQGLADLRATGAGFGSRPFFADSGSRRPDRASGTGTEAAR
jgi:hypothetical protein